MSAAATAAGYLYASGRLRGRGARDQEPKQQAEKKPQPPRERRDVRVAVYEPQEPAAHAPQEKPRRTPKIEYRTRRWKPDGPRDE
jgi:hypothetical protein